VRSRLSSLAAAQPASLNSSISGASPEKVKPLLVNADLMKEIERKNDTAPK
jgi:hypothetical protein